MLENATLAWFGGDAEITVGGRRVDDVSRFAVARGSVLAIGRIRGALRGVLAAAGGLDTGLPQSVASRRLTAGDVIGSARSATTTPRTAVTVSRERRLTLHAIAGPHRLDGALLNEVVRAEWIVTPELDRVGVRLRSQPPIATRPPADLPSIGAQCGSVQWHPDGSLVILGPDHPITGGYLQPLTIASGEQWEIAQLTPGDRVQLRLV